MNSYVLMAEIIKEPEVRYLSDNQLAKADIMVQFPNSVTKPDELAKLRVIVWGKLAEEIKNKYQTGDHIIIEGRLNMELHERPEGFKEKRAELTASKIHLVSRNENSSSTASYKMAEEPSNVVSLETRRSSSLKPVAAAEPEEEEYSGSGVNKVTKAQDLDDIPF
ncbi:MAG TPA: single-stranded DNA-binding protein [Allocoleopsis sp.]